MKSILISIQPKWCELIASGHKTIEVRKTIPNIKPPFRVYIYCTKVKPGKLHMYDAFGFGNNYADYSRSIIGECICIETFEFLKSPQNTYIRPKEVSLGRTCMTIPESKRYANGKRLFGMVLSNVMIYEKPKEITSAYYMKKCNSCETSGYESSSCTYDYDCMVPCPIYKAPQSWRYIEGVFR